MVADDAGDNGEKGKERQSKADEREGARKHKALSFNHQSEEK
jgi:hypothetical protein